MGLYPPTKEGWYCVEMNEEEEQINEIEEELPRAFKLFLQLAEIAEAGAQDIEGHREMHNRKTQLEDKGGVDASLKATTSAHATAVSTIPKKGGDHN